jgi:hypothetical protein
MPRFARMVLTLLLVSVFAATTALAQAPAISVRNFPFSASSPELFAWIQSHLAQFRSKNGCSVDPSGRCLPQGSGLSRGDNGSEVDPSGGRSTSPSEKRL